MTLLFLIIVGVIAIIIVKVRSVAFFILLWFLIKWWVYGMRVGGHPTLAHSSFYKKFLDEFDPA